MFPVSHRYPLEVPAPRAPPPQNLGSRMGTAQKSAGWGDFLDLVSTFDGGRGVVQILGPEDLLCGAVSWPQSV